MRLFDISRQTCCDGVSDLDLFYQTQATQAMAAGYFGGYTAKMQDIGRLELQRMEKALQRSRAKSTGQTTPQQEFNRCSKRLLKDLEAKGTVRTAVETTHLALHANHKDKTRAECFRTFPTVTFPVAQLLSREEIENNRKGGTSAITSIRTNCKGQSYTDAPVDLLYGFRGKGHAVQTLSVFEMLRYWSIEKVGTPTQKPRRSMWTFAGVSHKYYCTLNCERPKFVAGVHYVALESHNRLLVADLPRLGHLRHTWCWERRERPHVPVWSNAKIPRASFSPEENARIISVCMRPWNLDPADVTALNPLLTDLRSSGTCATAPIEGACSHARDASTPPRKRLRQKTHLDGDSSPPDVPCERRCYTLALEEYLNKGVVSTMAARFLTNLFASTAARAVGEDSESEGSKSSEEDTQARETHVGSLDVVQKTLKGIAMHSVDEGEIGMGRHGATIVLGTNQWSTAPLTEQEERKTKEHTFDGDYFPDVLDARRCATKAAKHDDPRPAPYAGAMLQKTRVSHRSYARDLREWFYKIEHLEDEPPNPKQLSVLHAVEQRLLDEIELENEFPLLKKRRLLTKTSDAREEALRGFVHGLPGTGTSLVIQWIIRMFTEAMGFANGVEFVCVAFQNRVAHTMRGATLHSAGNVPVGDYSQERKLQHTDVDVLYVRNQSLRWILIDEVFMIPNDLLGTFAQHFADAAMESQYKFRADESKQVFGGYNLMMFGDTLQLPPIPSSAALFLPPDASTCGPCAREMLEMFWGDGVDTINYFVELTQQMRIEDPWYSALLDQCRRGYLDDEMYNFIVGLPTEHCGSWMPPISGQSSSAAGFAGCENIACVHLQTAWNDMSQAGSTWQAMVSMECAMCSAERKRRNRLLEPNDKRLHEEPFLSAPYVHNNNDPKYHAMLLRAVEAAKRGGKQPQHILWVVAQDTLQNPKEVAKTAEQQKRKLERFLQFHDQKTAGIPGLLPLFIGMKARTTEKVARGKDAKGRDVVILKHTSCTIYGWDLHTADRDHQAGSQKMFSYLPQLIYFQFPDAEWQIHPRLPKGVFPLHFVQRTWMLSESGSKVSRKGFTLVPDYASTGFMMQGETLLAEIAECGDIFSVPGMTEILTTYVILSRVKRADSLLLLRAFSPNLFRFGSPPGPACLIKHMQRRLDTSGGIPQAAYTKARFQVLNLAAVSKHYVGCSCDHVIVALSR